MRRVRDRRRGPDEKAPIQKSPKRHRIMGNKRYLKKETLGQGAFGIVYSAFDTETSKTVAIKCLINNEAIEEFQEELNLLKRLKHPGIVPYLDSFVDPTGALHIVMEYAENGSLLDIVKTYGTLNEMIASVYTVQILTGLAYLHNQGIIHRDIKAANVLIQGAEAKLADFGLALDLAQYGHTLRETAGSPYWMAPEVINGDPVTTKCDIWSVGATIHELLTGKPPLFDLPPMPAMFQIAGPREIPIPTDFTPLCREFMSLCLNKNQKLRPDAQTLLQHPWLQPAIQMAKTMDNSLQIQKNGDRDMRSLTARLGSIAFWPNMSEREVPTPENMCLMLTDPKTFLKGAFLIMKNIRSTPRLPTLIQNLCGIRTILDSIDEPGLRTACFNLLQDIVPSAEIIATSLLIHALPQTLLYQDHNALHEKLTGLMLIFASSTGPRFICYSGLIQRIGELAEEPILSVFVPHILLMLFDKTVPPNVASIYLTKKDLIETVIKIVFKCSLHHEKYMAMLREQFCDTTDLTAQAENDVNELNTPAVSTYVFKIVSLCVRDGISLISKIAFLNPKAQLYLSVGFDPLTYMLTNPKKFEALSEAHTSVLMRVIENLVRNPVAREKLQTPAIVKALVGRITGRCEDDSSCIIQILCILLKQRVDLIELACSEGLCQALEKSMSIVEANIKIRDLICEIPITSPFAVWKMRETQLHLILLEMLSFPIWNRKAIHSLSYWAMYDNLSIGEHLLNNVDKIITMMKSEISVSDPSIIHIEVFTDISRLIQYSPTLGMHIFSNAVVAKILDVLPSIGPFGQVQFLDFLLQLVLHAPSPSKIAQSLVPQLTLFTQSSIQQVQKAALRMRIISRS